MKLVLVFLVSILVAISPHLVVSRQSSHQQRNGQLWWSKYNNQQPRQQNIEASLYYTILLTLRSRFSVTRILTVSDPPSSTHHKYNKFILIMTSYNIQLLNDMWS